MAIESGRNLSRRAAIGIGAGLGANLLLTGESNSGYTPQIKQVERRQNSSVVTLAETDFHPNEERPVALPRKVTMLFSDTVAEVNRFLTSERKLDKFSLYKINLDTQVTEEPLYFNAHPSLNRHELEFEMYPGIAYSQTDLQEAVFHEAMHVFAPQPGKDGKGIFTDGAVDGYMRHMRNSKDFLDPYDLPSLGGKKVLLDNTGLFPLFDESIYGKTKGGHPYDDQSELVASALTVMRYYPLGLLASVKTLRPGDRAKISDFMDHLLHKGSEAAEDSSAFQKSFHTVFSASK